MMTNKNVLLVATMLVALSSTIEARLQGHTYRVSSTNTYSSDKNRQQQQRQRELNEEEDDKILVAMEKEYREDEASKQKAYEKAMASHNKMVPDNEILQEVNSLDQDFAKKEEHAQAQAHAEQKEKEKEQAKATVVDDGIDGLDSIVKMKKEFKDYEDVQQQKKKIAADDKKLIEAVKQAQLALEKQNKDMAAQAHVHQLENDKVALVYHEASILELQMIEQQAQDEAMHEQLAEETILQKEEEEQMHLHRRKMELLMA
eukprot:CAMPEP_0170923774 /NCGR_PEP_ID=MMETSP0735-20130129/11241_1 /TAXON_ID=186038 /ORGANISM="Fragilariopsis kerguelensis, Strain L26-C5" /LENGTH=258 /DNA_ID=CAMNT_0011323433 /DNA_START=92 /DNA_END=869 /DNA_ORIENTATION=-